MEGDQRWVEVLEVETEGQEPGRIVLQLVTAGHSPEPGDVDVIAGVVWVVENGSVQAIHHVEGYYISA